MTALARASPSTRTDRADVARLLEDAQADLIGSPRKALQVANQALRLADACGDIEQQAAAQQVRGDALRFLGQHEEALTEYGRSGEFYRRLGRPADAARTDASAVDSLRCLGRATDALRLATRARRVFKRLGEELRSAVLDEIVGLVFLQQNDYPRALRQFDRARPVIAAVGRPLDLAALNNNAATTLTNLDRLAEAETLYAAARLAYRDQGTDAALARVDVNLGYLALRQGRYGAAVDLLRQAAEVFDSLHNVPLAVATRLDLADTYLAVNLLDEAGALSEEQLRLAAQFGLDNEHARALFYLSTLRGRLGRLDDALTGLIDAEAEFAKRDNLAWRTRCVLGRAALLLSHGEPADARTAIPLLRRAARVFDRLGLPSRQAVALAMLSGALLRVGRIRAAEDEARAALWLANSIGVPWLLFECHYSLGRSLQAAGDSERAYVAYRDAADALERVRAELQPEELRMSLLSDKTDVYQELVLLCLDRSAPAEALRHAERAKSRVFAEGVASSLDPVRQGVDAQVVGTTDARVLERMQALRDELVWLYSRLGESLPAATVQRLRGQVSAREAELLRLRRRLQPASRAHAIALGIADSSDQSGAVLEQLRRHLFAGMAVLEYFQAGDELVSFVFGGARLTTHRLGPMATVAGLVERFRFQMGKYALGDAYISRHADSMLSSVNDVLGQLYSLLIEPCADELLHTGRVVVVPHGPLHHLPFHALIDPTGMPLVDRVEVAYAPSSTVLAACLERPSASLHRGRRLLVGVSDPAIPQIAREIETLQSLFGGSLVLLDGDATEQSFRHHAPEADVIHLASHAIFRQDNPLFSAIKLADGWLSVYDFSSLRLRASLVTLSACETGINDVLSGDELVGLTRGLFQAGAASVVVSLWVVNDASTARLMERFYTHLEAGIGPAAAMRLGQKDLRRAYPHPYYWAPFLVMGRP